MPQKTQILFPVIHIHGNFSLILSLSPLSGVQVKVICKWLRLWAGAHFLPVLRLKGSSCTQVMVFQRSHTRSSCPPPESCRIPGSCCPALKVSPRAGRTTEWVCSLMENYSYCTRDNRNQQF